MACNCSKNVKVIEKDPLGCKECLEKHLSTAYVLYTEVLEDSSRAREKILFIGNMSCAEDHASALGMDELRDKIRGARKQFQSEGRADMDALLTALMEQRESEH